MGMKLNRRDALSLNMSVRTKKDTNRDRLKASRQVADTLLIFLKLHYHYLVAAIVCTRVQRASHFDKHARSAPFPEKYHFFPSCQNRSCNSLRYTKHNETRVMGSFHNV